MKPLTLRSDSHQTTLIGITEDMRDHLFRALLKHNWTEHHFELSNGTKFSVVTDIPDVHPTRTSDAFQSWIVRTDEYTVESFVEYIMSKYWYHGGFAFTKEQWDKANS